METNKKLKPELIYRGSVSKFTPRARLCMIILLMVLPAILCLIFIKTYGVNVVFWDQWEVVPMFDKMYSGHLTFADLFAQHNEHRLFFPQIFMLLIGTITHYNNLAEMYFSWFLMCLISYVIFIVYTRKFGYSERSLIRFVPVVWLVFTLRQFQNLLWGYQIQFYLVVLFLLMALYLLATSKSLGWRFSFSILSGVVCTFSLANGLLVWPIGLIQIFISSRIPSTAPKWSYLKIGAVWSIIGMGSYLAYLIGYVQPSGHPSLLYFMQHPITSSAFLLASIGNPFSSDLFTAIGIGLLLLLLYIWITGLLIKNKLGEGTSTPFFVSLVLFGLLSIALLTLGRSGFGAEQALSSHYATITVLGTVGFYLLALSLKIMQKLHTFILDSMLMLVVLGLITTNAHAILKDGPDNRDYLSNSAFYLSTYEYQSDQFLAQLYPAGSVVRERAKILEKYKLNVFSQPGLIITLQNISLPTESNIISYNIDRVEVLPEVIVVSGWSYIEKKSAENSQIYLVLKSNTQTYVFNTIPQKRVDVTYFFSKLNLNLDESGFMANIQRDIIGDGRYTLGIYIQKGDTKTLEYTDKNITVP
jgi:hypothetical protein